MNFVEYIPKGKANAIHLQELANLLNIPAYTVKKLVQAARREGAQIMSGACGYWIAEDEQEMSIYRDAMRKQAYTRLKTIKPINRALKQIGGQISLTELSEASEEGTVSEQE